MIRHRILTPVFPSRVVVLGGSGFVGQDLARHLTELGIEMVGLSSRQVDLLNRDSVEVLERIVCESDALVLISALTPDKGKDIRTLMRNLTMGEHLSAFTERVACSHIVYISSDAVYKDGENPIRETSCCNPSTFHGLMHLARERMLAHAVQKSKIPFLIVRPSLLYGANDTHNGYGPNRFMRTAKREGKVTLSGKGEEKRDHVYVKDLSRLTALCLMHRSEGVLNVATGLSISFFDLVQMIARLCAGEAKIEYLARTMPITHRHFDIAVALKAFPSFHYTPLQKGLFEALKDLSDRPGG